MIPSLRQSFNSKYKPEKYPQLLALLAERCGVPIGFRVSETPCFLPSDLIVQMGNDGKELIRQLVDSPEYRAHSSQSIPPEFNVPRESPHPMFIQVDFGLVRDGSDVHDDHRRREPEQHFMDMPCPADRSGAATGGIRGAEVGQDVAAAGAAALVWICVAVSDLRRLLEGNEGRLIFERIRDHSFDAMEYLWSFLQGTGRDAAQLFPAARHPRDDRRSGEARRARLNEWIFSLEAIGQGVGNDQVQVEINDNLSLRSRAFLKFCLPL